MKLHYYLFILFSTIAFSQEKKLPKGFSYLREVDSTIQKELRYCFDNNFIGTSIEGYEEDVLITSTKTANALKKVQKEFLEKGFCLKIYDAYRPQSAVNHFVRWAREKNDTLMKKEYYPELNKRHLFRLGYISTRSGHSRGSSVDLTIIDIKTGKDVDMGGPYDFFGNVSHITNNSITEKQKQNRRLLIQTMSKNGFRPYKNEWWHFTLRNEPFPKTYFNFPIE